MGFIKKQIIFILVVSFVGCLSSFKYTNYPEPAMCDSDSDCLRGKAKCLRRECHCTDELHIGDGKTKCEKNFACPTKMRSDCAKRFKDSVCVWISFRIPIEYTCRCKNGFFGMTKQGSECRKVNNWPRTNNPCLTDKNCYPFAHCKTSRGYCLCRGGTIQTRWGRADKCIESFLHSCKADADCDQQARCEQGKCICKGNTLGSGDYCRVGSPCPAGYDCGPGYGLCLKDPFYPDKKPVCRCDVTNKHGKCVDCLSNSDCNAIYSTCVNEMCKCKDELIKEGKTCKRAPLHTCQADADCDQQARCEQGKCICQGNTIGNGEYCRVSLSCPAGYDCGPANGICLKDPFFPDEPECRCDKDSAKNKHGKCVECVSDIDCDTTYSTCVNEICKCKDELIKEGKTCKRSGAPLHPCKTDADCNKNADCIQGKCYCGKTAYISYDQDGKRSRAKYTGNGEFCRETLACPGQYSCDEQEACIVDPFFPKDRECKCRMGTAKISADGNCEEVTECLKRGINCWAFSSCKLVRDTYTCICNTGYEMKNILLGDKTLKRCFDINECLTTQPCPDIAVCINLVGSYTCKCNEGYRNNAVNQHICEDVDECSEKLHTCDIDGNQICQNLPGSYTCSCVKGHVQSAGGCILPGRDMSIQVCHCRDNWECTDDGKCKCKEGKSVCTLCNGHWVGSSADTCQRTTECPGSWSEWAPKVAPKQNSCCLLCCC